LSGSLRLRELKHKFSVSARETRYRTGLPSPTQKGGKWTAHVQVPIKKCLKNSSVQKKIGSDELNSVKQPKGKKSSVLE